jgi:hypothetical protein
MLRKKNVYVEVVGCREISADCRHCSENLKNEKAKRPEEAQTTLSLP